MSKQSNQAGKIKCNQCQHIKKLSKNWKIQQSTCMVQTTPLGARPSRWPDVWRRCPDFQKAEETDG